MWTNRGAGLITPRFIGLISQPQKASRGRVTTDQSPLTRYHHLLVWLVVHLVPLAVIPNDNEGKNSITLRVLGYHTTQWKGWFRSNLT